ncbi:MAG: M48 family metalloprotease [Bifidobacteriaceae bacterium]|jgi:heat shock protein HtpX|nr:M48 family metalloprotease [Bifidobacteriaceae bacterium]
MYKNVTRNKINTFIIMFFFLALAFGIGWAVYYFTYNSLFLVIVPVLAFIYAFIQYFGAAKIALAVSGAKLADPHAFPQLYNSVENITMTMGLPMPKVYIINDPAPNAFATGRNPKDGHIAVTSGLLDLMDKRELEGVLSHEMSHIKNYDILVSTIVFGLVSAISWICDIFLRMMIFGNVRSSRRDNGGNFLMIFYVIAAILVPLIAVLVQLAVSRQREYLADATGALVMRDPDGLAEALEKLETAEKPMLRQNTATSHLFFVNPLSRGNFISKLFSTHPPLADRIARLKASSGQF